VKHHPETKAGDHCWLEDVQDGWKNVGSSNSRKLNGLITLSIAGAVREAVDEGSGRVWLGQSVDNNVGSSRSQLTDTQ
jgi:hypothetical protein